MLGANVSFGSTPVIENSEPNFGKGWKAVTRSSRLNDAPARQIRSFAAFRNRKPVHRRRAAEPGEAVTVDSHARVRSFGSGPLSGSRRVAILQSQGPRTG